MKINEYQELALRTANTDNLDDLILNGALGLCGETGEVVDLIKKHLFQGHDLDADVVGKELGDVLWYVAVLAEGIGKDLESIMVGNIDKLRERYPLGFDAERSVNREV